STPFGGLSGCAVDGAGRPMVTSARSHFSSVTVSFEPNDVVAVESGGRHEPVDVDVLADVAPDDDTPDDDEPDDAM
ncbi:MAG: hypothetical protein J2O49_09530, partial [Sciscionella sp.]|nr:hypothetical protein [Sciscionella sp.]